MIVLGIDPGSLVTGYGAIDASAGRLRPLASGRVRPDAGAPLSQRLLQIHAGIMGAIEAHRPDVLAVESLFNARNAHSSLVLGHARGVVLLAGAQQGLEVAEYSPREIKSALTGQGGAVKEQVRYMVCRLLGLPAVPGSLDESDALAVALCHALRGAAPAAARAREEGAR